jgi:TfoX/Sxy family transcriptional regulator of competence genes
MGKMMQFSPKVAEIVEEAVRDQGYAAIKRKMFGQETWFLNGYMFAGGNENGVYVHVGEREKEEALGAEKGVQPFEPLKGRAMKEYVLLDETIHSQPEKLRLWLDKGSAYLLALPEKR